MKNAVIVPVGRQGRVRREAPARGPGRPERRCVACYRTFICGLLDVTDNLVSGPDGRAETVPPRGSCATTGTTPTSSSPRTRGPRRSPTSRTRSPRQYGFWLGDAFASGGSKGYDHKAMGITARGAWESVKRHFRELGVDTQAEDFTVVGIGDMSGDVFGNGMLLSPHIRLVAAFDHRHVFVDPTPDAARGFAERQRLFALPRSSWDDYDRDAISAGGGVWPRTAKSVPRRAGDPRRRWGSTTAEVDPAQPAGADPRDPAGAGRPAVERRDRHLRQGERGDPRRRRGQGQRRGPGRRERAAGQGRRRGRQPRAHPAGPDRVRPQRREDQHRRDRQLRGRGLLRPRGQHQDPARPAGRGRRRWTARRATRCSWR